MPDLSHLEPLKSKGQVHVDTDTAIVCDPSCSSMILQSFALALHIFALASLIVRPWPFLNVATCQFPSKMCSMDLDMFNVAVLIS